MALKNPWEVSSKPKAVPVYADGERIGTAESASVNLTGFYGPIESVEFTGLSERPVPVSRLQASYDVMVRDRKIEELEAEVERLKASRKEQAEKHRQKMRNLQNNFEQQSNGKTMNSKLRRELQASKDYAQTLRKTVDRQTSEINSLNSKLRRERGNDSYWHEKYLESERAVADLSESRKRLHERGVELSADLVWSRNENKKLINECNRLNDDINRFIEDFSEGATAINRAVEDWNATVPE